VTNIAVTGSWPKTIEVIDAATGSKARMTAASVAVTRACPHISATKASAVVTMAVKTMAKATSRDQVTRGANALAGAAARPTTITCTAARPSAGLSTLTFAERTTCSAEQTAQPIVRRSPAVGRASTPPMRSVVPKSASAEPIHAAKGMRVEYRTRSANGTKTT